MTTSFQMLTVVVSFFRDVANRLQLSGLRELVKKVLGLACGCRTAHAGLLRRVNNSFCFFEGGIRDGVGKQGPVIEGMF